MVHKTNRMSDSLVNTDEKIIDLVMKQRDILVNEDPYINGKERSLLQAKQMTQLKHNVRSRLSAHVDSGLLQKGYKKALIKNMLVTKQMDSESEFMQKETSSLEDNDFLMK